MMKKQDLRRFRRAYNVQRCAARYRKIEWKFESFEQWLEWWGEDIYRRGRYAGQLVMARYNDSGPYHPDNVRKVPAEFNVHEAQVGHVDSAETRRRRSRSMTGHAVSAETREKISERLRGRLDLHGKPIQTPAGWFPNKAAAARHYQRDVSAIDLRLRNYPDQYYLV